MISREALRNNATFPHILSQFAVIRLLAAHNVVFEAHCWRIFGL